MNHIMHYIVMTCIMILSGLLSSMYVWADSWRDIRIGLNDAYMIGLMTSWSLLFTGIYDHNGFIVVIGILLVIFFLWAIRTQFHISEHQYLVGMIPHHSMAIQMSKRLQEKPNNIKPFLDTIIMTQTKEISIIKDYMNPLPYKKSVT